jgi:hypothetical protein
VEEVLDLFVEEVKTYTEGMDIEPASDDNPEFADLIEEDPDDA